MKEHPGGMTSELRVGGVVPFTTIDYPGHLAAVIFCQGCPWRCGYCHNPHLQPAQSANGPHWHEVLAFLATRRGLLEAVVFSGGEPTLQAGLPGAMRAVRALGFKVGLHTAGIYPKRLAEVLPLVDWVGLDIKAPFRCYDRVTGVPCSGARARESARLLAASGVACEFRTTVDPALIGPDELDEIETELRRFTSKPHVLQSMRKAPEGS